jgi:hypothetical protein
MKRRLLLIILAVLAVATFALADTATVTIVNVGPGSVGGPNVGGNVYVYPYYMSVNGSSTLTPMICDDYAHEVYLGESWTATVSSFTNLSSAEYFNLPGSTKLYEEAAYLYAQIGTSPTNAVLDNYAIWYLFNPSNSDLLTGLEEAGLTVTEIKNLIANAGIAIASLPASYWNQFAIYTPVGNPGSDTYPQEMIGFVTVTNVSEPGIAALLGFGLIPLWVMRKKKAL